MKKNRYSFGLMLIRLVLLVALLLAPVVSVPPAPVQAGESGPTNPDVPGALAGIFLPLVNKPYTPPEPSSQEKIYAKYEAGDIDYETYLLYRAYALYGDLNLPAELIGPIDEDLSLFHEIENPQQPLSQAMLDKLQPYLVRPDDPISAVNGSLPVPEGVASDQNMSAAGEFPDSWTCSDADGDGFFWAKLDSATHPLRVHHLCFNDVSQDQTSILPSMQLVLADLDALWEPMAAHMGTEPLADLGGPKLGGDERLDVYLIAKAQTFQRGDEAVRFEVSSMIAFAAGTASKAQYPKKAGYVVVDQALLNDPVKLKGTLAHEFFHLLQFAHNAYVMWNSNSEPYWFNDASADWAILHFVPEARRRIHAARFPGFQADDMPLNITGKNGSIRQRHNYNAYIWPFFMEQQAGAESIAAAWDGLVNAKTFQDADNVLNSQVSFISSFHLFALRNLVDVENFGRAIPNAYAEFDPTFPPGMWPKFVQEKVLDVDEAPYSVPVALRPLTADYYYYELDQDSGAQRIDISFEGIQQRKFLDIDAVLYIQGVGWQVRSWSGSSKVKLCLDQAGERVSSFYLVLSDTDYAGNLPILGDMTISPRREGCSCQNLQDALSRVKHFEGQIHFDFSANLVHEKQQLIVSQFADVTTKLSVQNKYGNVYQDLAPGGNGTYDMVRIRNGDRVAEMHASGPPVPDTGHYETSWVSVAFDFRTCKYSLFAEIAVPTGDGGVREVGSFRTDWLRVDPETLELTGGGLYPIYSARYIEENGPIPFFNRMETELTEWRGEGNLFGNVGFSLGPVFKP